MELTRSARRPKRPATWRRATRGRRLSSPCEPGVDPGDRVIDHRPAARLVVRLVTEARIHATRHVRASLQRSGCPFGDDRIVRAMQNVRLDGQRSTALELPLDPVLLSE